MTGRTDDESEALQRRRVPCMIAYLHPFRFVDADGEADWSLSIEQINTRDWDHVALHRLVGGSACSSTDAACEGLNLQRLGSQINVDTSWNPSRLEQRKGRIQRIGQLRDVIHVVNMRYACTVEDDVYSALSERFNNIFAVLGQLPVSIEDAWVEAVLKDREALRYFPQRVETISSPMEKRYWNDVCDDARLDWGFTEKMLSSHDIEAHMRQGWR